MGSNRIQRCLCRLNYVLITHFLLNLQDVSTVIDDEHDTDPSQLSSVRWGGGQLSTIQFQANTILGNIGAPLRDDGDKDEDKNEDGGETDTGAMDSEEYVSSGTGTGSSEETSIPMPASTSSSTSIAAEKGQEPGHPPMIEIVEIGCDNTISTPMRDSGAVV